MYRAHLVIGAVVLVVALGALALIGARVMDRDRRAIHADHARDKMHLLEEAALELGNDVEKIGEDLELAAVLVTQSASPDVRDRELHAIATITREYLMLEVRDADSTTLVYVPPEVEPVIERARAMIDETIASARAEPGLFKTSRPLGDGDAAWYRVFARRSPSRDDLVVAIVVDLRPLLARLRLLADSGSALLVLGAHGLPSPSSDERLAEAVRALPSNATPRLAELVEEVRARRSASVTIGDAEAARLGLPSVTAVGVAVPVLIEDGEPWGLVLVSSTDALRTQERTLLRRMIVVGGLAAAVIVLLSAYFVWNARRAAALRERLRQADQVAHAEKLATAGQLAAGIAHEIGTPLNVVRGRAELTLSRLGPGHPQAPGVQIIVEQIDHVSGLITQLLDYVRPQPPAVAAVDPGAALRSAEALLTAEAAKRGVHLAVELHDDLPALRADAGQLQQVLVNLTMNALDACGKGGHVTLRAPRAGVIEVADDGVGIPAASRAQVFDPFFTTKKRGQGTGLGLWVVAQLVRAHDGSIELTSTPGSGTTFRITWPTQPT